MDLFGFLNGITILEIIILVTGTILVIIEIFHPGFGAPGISGAILLLLGILLTAQSLLQALFMILVLIVVFGVLLVFVIKSAISGRLSRKVILSESQSKDKGYNSIDDLESYAGKTGLVINTLRPSGIADIEGIKLDVVSEGEFIEKGKEVTVIKVEGRRIVVREK